MSKDWRPFWRLFLLPSHLSSCDVLSSFEPWADQLEKSQAAFKLRAQLLHVPARSIWIRHLMGQVNLQNANKIKNNGLFIWVVRALMTYVVCPSAEVFPMNLTLDHCFEVAELWGGWGPPYAAQIPRLGGPAWNCGVTSPPRLPKLGALSPSQKQSTGKQQYWKPPRDYLSLFKTIYIYIYTWYVQYIHYRNTVHAIQYIIYTCTQQDKTHHGKTRYNNTKPLRYIMLDDVTLRYITSH